MASVLLLVDVQRNMLEPPEPVPDAASVSVVLTRLLDRARAAGSIVVHIRNNGVTDDPDVPGSHGWELVHEVLAGESVVDKVLPDAFARTNLADLLPPRSEVVVAGMQSEFCVRATALAAISLGHRVILPRGGHATYHTSLPAAEQSKRVESELLEAGARVIDFARVAFERASSLG